MRLRRSGLRCTWPSRATAHRRRRRRARSFSAMAGRCGGFRNVQAEGGRFRDYVKGVLFRLVRKHWRRQERQAQPLATEVDLTDPECFTAACDEQFRQSWRDELLARTWEDLALREHTYF